MVKLSGAARILSAMPYHLTVCVRAPAPRRANVEKTILIVARACLRVWREVMAAG
jgi:hypothetical protein